MNEKSDNVVEQPCNSKPSNPNSNNMSKKSNRKRVGSIVVGSTTYPIYKGINIIGRDPRCDINLTHLTVSKKHAEIEAFDRETIFVSDLQSSNGTILNHKMIKPNKSYQVRSGNELILGEISAIIQLRKYNDDNFAAPANQNNLQQLSDISKSPNDTSKKPSQSSMCPVDKLVTSTPKVISCKPVDAHDTGKLTPIQSHKSSFNDISSNINTTVGDTHLLESATSSKDYPQIIASKSFNLENISDTIFEQLTQKHTDLDEPSNVNAAQSCSITIKIESSKNGDKVFNKPNDVTNKSFDSSLEKSTVDESTVDSSAKMSCQTKGTASTKKAFQIQSSKQTLPEECTDKNILDETHSLKPVALSKDDSQFTRNKIVNNDSTFGQNTIDNSSKILTIDVDTESEDDIFEQKQQQSVTKNQQVDTEQFQTVEKNMRNLLGNSCVDDFVYESSRMITQELENMLEVTQVDAEPDVPGNSLRRDTKTSRKKINTKRSRDSADVDVENENHPKRKSKRQINLLGTSQRTEAEITTEDVENKSEEKDIVLESDEGDIENEDGDILKDLPKFKIPNTLSNPASPKSEASDISEDFLNVRNTPRSMQFKSVMTGLMKCKLYKKVDEDLNDLDEIESRILNVKSAYDNIIDPVTGETLNEENSVETEIKKEESVKNKRRRTLEQKEKKVEEKEEAGSSRMTPSKRKALKKEEKNVEEKVELRSPKMTPSAMEKNKKSHVTVKNLAIVLQPITKQTRATKLRPRKNVSCKEQVVLNNNKNQTVASTVKSTLTTEPEASIKKIGESPEQSPKQTTKCINSTKTISKLTENSEVEFKRKSVKATAKITENPAIQTRRVTRKSSKLIADIKEQKEHKTIVEQKCEMKSGDRLNKKRIIDETVDHASKICNKKTRIEIQKEENEVLSPVLSRTSSRVRNLNENLDESFSCSSTTERKRSVTTPNGSSRNSQFKILFTGIDDTKEKKNYMKKLGISKADNLASCKLLLTDKVRRTVKFLCALARGLPIISVKWLEDSFKANKCLEWDDYILKDTAAENKFGFNLQKSLNLANKKKLFEGYTIFLTPKIESPPLADLKEIITTSGGTCMVNAPRRWPKNSVIVTTVNDLENARKFIMKAPKSVTVQSTEFILSGILKQQIDLKKYILEV